ncbi:MAG: hypothetical protein ACFFDN_36900 [Candidatus Hodarchaeota archaeon]
MENSIKIILRVGSPGEIRTLQFVAISPVPFLCYLREDPEQRRLRLFVCSTSQL